VIGCTFIRNTASVYGGGLFTNTRVSIEQCTFVANEAPVGAAFRSIVQSGANVSTRRCVFALHAMAAAYAAGGATVDCNLFWSNSGGDYSGYTPGPNDLFVDPQFCDIPADDYTVRNTSPCAEENSPVCGQIGAYGIGCGTVSVEPTSWSRVKSWYREEE
jgi:predicted outer membrane repeat protein